MTVRRQRDFSLHALAPLLEEEGWDVSVHESLIAIREHADGFFQLKVDRGGRMHLQRVFPYAPPLGRTVTRAGREYAFHQEIMVKREVATQIERLEDFFQAFNAMQALVLEPGAVEG